MLATQEFVATAEGNRHVGAAEVLHRHGGRAAVAVSVGVAGGVPNQSPCSRRQYASASPKSGCDGRRSCLWPDSTLWLGACWGGPGPWGSSNLERLPLSFLRDTLTAFKRLLRGDTMPERSPEIEQVLRDTMDAMARSDLDEIGRRTSRDPCVIGIGSDPSEWTESYDDLVRLMRDSTPDAGLGITVGLDDVKAFREGSVGWAAGHGYFEMDGKHVPVRITAVLHQENGEWKAVQTHASIGVPNDRMLDPMFQTSA